MRSEPVKILATRCSNHDQHFTVGCDIQLLRLLFNMILENMSELKQLHIMQGLRSVTIRLQAQFITQILTMRFSIGLQQQRLWKDVKNEKKALLLKFYKDLLSIREHIQSRQVDEDDSEENEEDFVPNDDIPTSSTSGI
uniref:Uncharacterized protein n=1 Tax=Magallana gigas TaxID=29159 RepID=A0A8W8JB00_MAGGI